RQRARRRYETLPPPRAHGPAHTRTASLIKDAGGVVGQRPQRRRTLVRARAPLTPRRWLATGVGCAAAATVVFAATRDPKKKSGAPPPLVPVQAAQVTQGDVGVFLVGLGAVTPIATVTLRSRVDGQLMKVGYREGAIVEKGQLLALIDPRPF